MDKQPLQFMDACAKLCVLRKDYNHARVPTHNKAMNKLYSIKDTVKETPQYAESFYHELMNNPDLVVRSYAAMFALDDEFCADQAIRVLEEVNKIDDPQYNLLLLNCNWALKTWREKHGLPSPWQPF